MPRVKKIVPKVLLALPVPVLVVILWSQGVKYGWTLPFDIRLARVPSPTTVMRRITDLAFGGYFDDPYSAMLWKHTYASLVRVFSGFGLAALIGVPLGVLMGRSKIASAMLEPTINLIRPIPVTAWVPLTLIMIGIGDRSTIFLVFLAALFPIILNTVTAVEQVPERLLEAAAMLGTSKGKALWKVVFPAALHYRRLTSRGRFGLGAAGRRRDDGYHGRSGCHDYGGQERFEDRLDRRQHVHHWHPRFSQRSTHRLDRQTCGARSPDPTYCQVTVKESEQCASEPFSVMPA